MTKKEFNIHDWQAKINEQGFDDRLKAAGGFSDEEMADITSRDVGDFMSQNIDKLNKLKTSRDIGNLHGNKASDLIEKLRGDYRGMSDEELDDFSVEMIEHFLDNTAAQAAAKIYFGKKQL